MFFLAIATSTAALIFAANNENLTPEMALAYRICNINTWICGMVYLGCTFGIEFLQQSNIENEDFDG
ncbi:hypothetical protein WKK05_36335 (plasmid) [Nostoc sp. UHCC 0302]|uniref:hypothetical protein n=1 Tax=Nostoc sp. UHCC 0302 TaxID=3134896 RepID=UPI00311CD445